jgi:PAS domain S-box-containing protein
MKILYVEDNPRDADLTVRMLSKTAPHLYIESVSTINKGRERLDRLASEPLDLVLTDMHLADGDGLSLLKHIRESSLPLAVVVVTGMGDEETAVNALKASADDYVVKSRDYLDRLPVILQSALNHYRATAARRNHPLNVLYAETNAGDTESTLRHLAVHANHLHLDVVSRGSDVIRLLQQKEKSPAYDVLLMAVHLPELNALEVLRELRFTQKLDIPVVLVCREDEQWARQALNLGASSYVMKTPGYLYQLPWHIEDAYSRADLMRREAALHASEARNRAILNAIPDLMFLHALDGTYLDYHAADPKLLIKAPEEFLGKKVSDVMSPELAEKFNECVQQTSDKPVYLEYELSLPDGNRVFEASMVRCEGDKVLAMVRDITERKSAEEALRESERRLRVAQQAARVGTWEWDVRTGVSVWSEMIWELLGLEPDDGASTVERFVAFIHPEDRDRVLRKVNEVIAEGEEYYDEFRMVQRDGRVLWVSSKGRLLRSSSGLPERMLGVNIDITERKLADEALKNALAEVQQLKDRLHEENVYLQEEIKGAGNFGEIVGKSAALKRVLQQTEQVAPLNTTVLVLGETGTGKELLAHAIHNNSPRRKRTLVKVNCAALPAPLIESELFGHEKGAFTSADRLRLGRFEIANGGTLFLDEVGELPLELQAKLLRVLEEGEFERVGGSRTVSVDVRVIAATNRNLAEAVARGTFRSDLYYRLNVFPIRMPSLRDRVEDIPVLVTHLVEQISSKFGKEIVSVPQSAMAVLENYHWPGNVRELRNVIERAVIITQGSKLRIIDSLDLLSLEPTPLPVEQENSNGDKQDDTDTLEQNEHRLIVRTLKKVHWRVEGPGGAADLLGLNASTLRSKMKKLGIARPRVQSYSG